MIKIGIIDSGLNCTTAGIASDKVTGKSFGQKSLGDTALNAHNFTDQLGHGTHCACIIAQAVPHAQYYIAKIFQHNLSSDVETLVAALYWCIEQQVDLVNISLGIRSKIMHPGLQRACDLAYEQGIVLIAAANNDNQICFPAYYHKVLGVGHATLTGGADFIWVADSAIECYTTPPPLQNTLTHTNSTSFCCPVISGWAAKYMLDEGLRGPAAIRERLARAGGAQHKYYLPLHPAHGYTSPADFEPTKLRGIAQRYLAACGMLEPLGRIRLAPLNDLAFSFMEGLAPVMSQPLRCTGNFSLSSKGQLDAAFSNPNLEDSFDTIALGQLAYYLDGNNEALFTDGLERLLHHKKKFLVFDDSSAAIIQKKALEIGVESFVHQQVFDQRLYHDFRQFRFLPAITTPILAITGTGYQEVVSLQLYLKDFLTANGIRTACISPALQGNLMGADFALPLVFNDSSKLTGLQLCNMVSDAVKALQFFCQPQLIIAGTVNAVLPPFDSDGFGWADNVALLQSLQPDALLCVIEADVEKEKIQKNLAALYANTHCPILLQASQLATLQSYEPFANNLFSEYRLTTLNDKEDWQNLLGWVNHIIHQSTPS